MAEIDWGKVLPIIKMNVKDLYLEMGAETQRKSDLERIQPLVEALQQILDYGTLDGVKYWERWGATARGDFLPRELAYAVLSDLGVLPGGVEE